MSNSDDSTPPIEGVARVRRVRVKSRRGARRRVFLRIGLGIVAVGVLSGTAAGTLAYQASHVQAQLEHVVDLVPQLRAQLSKGENSAAQATLETMLSQTTAARATVTGPLWKVASTVPILGPNFTAVAEAAVSADDVAARAIAPLLTIYDSLDWHTLAPVEGRIDVNQVEEATPKIVAAANTVRLSYERMESIELSDLLPQVADPIRSATDQLHDVSLAMRTASSAAQLLPAMLGTEGPRTYLVLVQNSAEARATGGIPGALAILSTDAGKIQLGEQSSAGALGLFMPSLAVDPEQEALYTKRLGTHMQNVNLTPHFPTAADTARRMWEDRHRDTTVDGVIGLDPVALSHLLKATGPVELVNPEVLRLIEGTSLPITLTNDNVVATLLSDVYREIEEPTEQDAYFAAVAGQIFGAFADGRGDGSQLLEALSTSVHENRLALWSSRSKEQSILSTTAVSGSVQGAEVGGASFGVYFNDGTGAKMDYYAARTVQLQQQCGSDGYSDYTVRLNISNTAPLDSVSALPAYVTGGGAFGVDPGNIRTNYVIYGPAQAFVETATVNGQTVPFGSGRHGQRPVGTVALELEPGESAQMDIVFSRVVQSDVPRLRVTPGVEAPEKMVLPTQTIGCS